MANPFDATAFCDDEDVLDQCEDDFPSIYPDMGVRAKGADGAIAADSWVLTSASKDFAAQGVVAGMLCVLEREGDADAAGIDSTTYAVDSVAGHSLTLRLPGADSGAGEPPGTGADLADVTFTVVTNARYIAEATAWVKRQLDFDAAGDLIAAEDLDELTACRVAQRLYAKASRNPKDDYAGKAALLRERCEYLTAELQARRRAVYPVDFIPAVPQDSWSPPA